MYMYLIVFIIMFSCPCIDVLVCVHTNFGVFCFAFTENLSTVRALESTGYICLCLCCAFNFVYICTTTFKHKAFAIFLTILSFTSCELTWEGQHIYYLALACLGDPLSSLHCPKASFLIRDLLIQYSLSYPIVYIWMLMDGETVTCFA